MSAEWKEYRLGDITEWASGGTPSKKNADFWDGTIPWISASSMGSNRYNESNLKITQEGLKAGSRIAKKNSILLLVRGSTLHQRIPVGIATSDVSFNQDVKAIIAKEDFIEPWYLLFWFMAKEKDLLNMVENTGIGAGKLDTKRLQDMLIKIPSDVERNRICRFAKALDDKLLLNRQINQTLESMAQAIFKSWFVDFDPVKAKLAAIESGEDAEGVTRAAMRAISGKTDDELDQMHGGQPEDYAQLKTTAGLFPAAMQETELGEVPEGWMVADLKELSKTISKGTTPSKKQVADAEGTPSINFIKVKDITNDGQINSAGLGLIHESIHKGALKRSMLEENDLLFSIAGTIGRVSIVENELHNSNTNQAVAFIRLNVQEHLSLVLEHLKSKRIQESAMASVVQGVQANVSLTSVGSFQIIVPKEPILAAWNEVVLPLHTEKLGRQKQNRLLSQLRDTLLPKLLSGELKINAANKAER